MVQLSDTSPEADRVLTEAYRRMSLGQKWLLLSSMYRDARVLHAAGVRLRNPAVTPREILEDWMAVNLGLRLAATSQVPAVEQSVLQELRAVTDVFTDLGIAYALGGSMASSLYGISRQTRDADVTVEPFPGKEAQLLARLGADYYVSLPAIEDALRNHTCFNIINTSSGFKVDAFVCPDQGFERTALERRTPVLLPDLPERPIVVHTPEDLVLFKLRWYRLGNEASDQQWKDVLGVLKVQGDRLDRGYLDQWAANLQVDDLLRRARLESGT